MQDSISRKTVRAFGVLIALAGLAAIILTLAIITSGFLYDICTKTGYFGNLLKDNYVARNKLTLSLLLIGMLSTPVLCVGFLMYAKWKEDLRFAKSKLILMFGFVLFFPAPLLSLAGIGLAPPVLLLLFMVMSVFGAVHGPDAAAMAMLSLISFLGFAVLLLMGHVFSSFVYRYAKKIYIHWIIFAILAIVGIFGKYFWGDVGGGEHGGSILELFKEMF
jgi:hypothetical protein